MNKDLQDLKILSIFYYVIGGLLALFSCFALIYLFIGAMFVAAAPSPASQVPAPPPEIGWIFILLSITVLLIGWAWAAALMAAGWFLGRYRHYLYCMVMGCSALLFQPFGTILGVFTIIVLLRPSVKRLFETGETPYNPEEDESDGFHDDHIRVRSYNIHGER